MKWLLSRLAEPSTWAGLAAFIPAAMGASAGPLTPQVIAGLAGGLAAALIPEKKAQ